MDADESSSGFVVDNNIRTFSIFGAVGFESKPTSDIGTAKSLSINFDLSTAAVCPENKIKIKALSTGDPVNDVLVRLLKSGEEIQSTKTNVSGDVEFLLTSNGAYKLDAQKNGYAKPDAKEFNYTLCEEAVAANITNVTVPIPTPQPVPTPQPTGNVTPEPQPTPEPTPPPSGKKAGDNVTVEPGEVEKKGEATVDNTYLYATLLIVIVALIIYYYLSRKKGKRKK